MTKLCLYLREGAVVKIWVFFQRNSEHITIIIFNKMRQHAMRNEYVERNVV